MGEPRGRSEQPRVERLALELVGFCDRIEGAIIRAGKRGINEHLQDSAASALANVGEALDATSVREKRKFFGYALRSAGECQRQLRGAARVRAIGAEELTEGLRLVRYLKFDLRRLIAWCDRQITPTT